VRIYQLSNMGKRLARTTNNPDTPNWRVLHYLDNLSYATTDQIAMATGLDERQTAGSLVLLRHKGLVEER
jgi:hypothetical protein